MKTSTSTYADLVGAEDEILKATYNSTNEANIPPISVSANQGKFLQVLAKACNAKKILEIGTLVGIQHHLDGAGVTKRW